MFVQLPLTDDNFGVRNLTKGQMIYVRASSIATVSPSEDGMSCRIATTDVGIDIDLPASEVLARIEAAEAASAPQLPDIAGILGSVMGMGSQEEGEAE